MKFLVCTHTELLFLLLMKNLTTKIRIKDIAELAGVSEGTVDRVIHQRGDVSEKSRLAVTKVLEEINYKPNILARSLASKKQYTFVCLFPSYQPGEYWEKIEQGFLHAAQEFVHYNVLIQKFYFDQFDVNSFIEKYTEILALEPDAVFLSPIFREEANKFTSFLNEREIPFSFIDSTIEEANYLTYYGQNSFQSGYIAAKLLLSSVAENTKILIIRTQRKGSVSNQTIARHKGFQHYLEESGLKDKYELVNVEFKDNDEEANLALLRAVFDGCNNIKSAITFNSKVYRLAMHLETLGQTNVTLIGYDLLDKNVSYLKQGVISYLIAQRPDKQAYFTVRDMCRQLIFKQDIKRINYVPIDILMKENIEDYLHFSE